MQVQTTARPAVEVGSVARSAQGRSSAQVELSGDLVKALCGVPHGEITVGLCASDMPTRRFQRGEISPGQLAAWTVQGLERLGERDAWWIDYRARELVRTTNAFSRCQGDEEARYERLWPTPRRAELANDVAYRLDHHRAAVGMRPMPDDVWVLVDQIDGCHVLEHRRVRDLDLALKYGLPPDDLTWPL